MNIPIVGGGPIAGCSMRFDSLAEVPKMLPFLVRVDGSSNILYEYELVDDSYSLKATHRDLTTEQLKAFGFDKPENLNPPRRIQ